MPSTNDTTLTPGTKMPTGEKIAAWGIVLMIIYLVIAQ